MAVFLYGFEGSIFHARTNPREFETTLAARPIEFTACRNCLRSSKC